MKKLLFFSYVVFLFLFTFFSYLFIDPNLSYLKNLRSEFVFSHRLEISIGYVFLIIIHFVFYLIFLKMFKEKRLGKKDIKAVVVITCGVLLFSYPAMLSFDIFNYLLTAKVAFFYHENPYIIMPIQFLGDPMLAFTHGANKIALYGPSWITITSAPYLLGLGNFILTLLNFKLAILAFYLGTTWLIHKMSKDYVSVILFSLNPLVVIETLLGGHNDIVMMFFALLSFFLLSKKKAVAASIFILISFLIKYSTFFLLPVFAYALVKPNKKSISWEKIYKVCAILMFIAFILSPFKEEMYPWYAIWFLPFAALSYKNKIILYISLAFSFSLLLRYVPFMLLGTYFGPTPLIKILATGVPVAVVSMYILIKEKLWLKKFFR